MIKSIIMNKDTQEVDTCNNQEKRNLFRMESLLLSDCFGRDDTLTDFIRWIGLLKLLFQLTGVQSLFKWFKLWIFQDHKDDGFVEMQSKIQNLEQQIQFLQHEQKRLSDENESKESECACYCPVHGRREVVTSSGGCVSHVPPPAPPPPPPPPPLPVVPLKRRILSEKNNNVPKKMVESTKSMVLTPDDLMRVTLKTPKKRHHSENGANDIMTPLVTESDLRNKKLNRVIPQTPGTENIQQRIAQEVLCFKNGLKKTDIKRSPGGTPMMNRKKPRRGSRLAPVMAIALKKKFITVHSPDTSDTSISPQSMDNSPFF